MKPEDVYEKWRMQRASIEAPSELESNLMSMLAGLDAMEDKAESTSRPAARGLLDQPAWAAVAMVAASIIGIARISVALLIGIL